LRDRIRIVGDGELVRGTSEAIVSMQDGVVYREFGNVSIPSSDLDEQGRRLEAKFLALAKPVIGDARAHELIERVRRLDELEGVEELLLLTRSTR
jgi:hypothetical protein